MLDQNSPKAPTTFEVVFLYKKVRYLYGFSLNRQRVLEEWLYSYPKKHPRLLFERHQDKRTKKPKFKFGPTWRGGKATLTKLVRHNTLLVSVGSQAGLSIPFVVTDWFSNKLRSLSNFPAYIAEEEYTKELILKDEVAKKNILDFLNNADINIKDIIIEKIPLSEQERKKLLDIQAVLAPNSPPAAREFEPFEAKFVRSGYKADDSIINVTFDLFSESDGTRKLFALAGPILYVLAKGCCLVVDELDVKLHPLLSREIVRIFHDKRTNPRGAQLIFATHDSNLMDIKNLFRRDQIWFTVKNTRGESSLYSLWDFKKPRKDENIINGYLSGRYGAIPFLDGLIK
jgi:hypothetical protein